MESIAEPQPRQTKNLQLSGWIAGSILFHGLLIWLLDHEVQLPAEPQKADNNTITATLVFAPPPEIQIVETPPADLPVDVIEPVQQEVVEAEVAKEIPVTETVLPQVPSSPETDTLPPTVDSATPRRNDLPPISSTDMLRQHMNNLATQKTQSMAESAAQDYRQKRISPSFPAAKIDAFQTPEEKLLESATVEVDCSSTTNKTVMAVAGLLGGMMKCSKPPPFQGFIDKRLKKQTDN